jgi:hypothetical protein
MLGNKPKFIYYNLIIVDSIFSFRLLFIFAVQSWENLQSNWIPIAIALLLSLLKGEKTALSRNLNFTFISLFNQFESNKLLKEETRTPEKIDESNGNISIFSNHYAEVTRLGDLYCSENLIDSVIELCFASPEIARRTWTIIFPIIWKTIPQKHQAIVGKYLRHFALAKHQDNHAIDVAVLIESLVQLQPPIEIKPHHWRYLASVNLTYYSDENFKKGAKFEKILRREIQNFIFYKYISALNFNKKLF